MKLTLIPIVALTAYAAAAHADVPSGMALPGRGGGGTNVDCNHNGQAKFKTIGAAVASLQGKAGSTINVSGACQENVVIQSMDRLTLNANAGASITDASGGTLDVIQIVDSRSVSINNFTINGGDTGIDCLDASLCRLNGNTVQNAGGAGVGVFGLSQAVVSGGTIQGSGGVGIEVRNGSSAHVTGVMIVNNPGIGMEILGQSFVTTDSIFANNGGAGIFMTHNAMLNCIACQVTDNGNLGIIARRDSSVRFSGGSVVTGNSGGGILLTESSSAYFANPGTVTGNPGGMDVFCGASFTTARQATTDIGGGTTNCVEPPQ